MRRYRDGLEERDEPRLRFDTYVKVLLLPLHV